MAERPVIPTPPAQKWREFRIRVVPGIVFACTVLLILFLWRDHVLPPTLVAEVEPIRTEVKSLDSGVVTNLYVALFERVRSNDVVAQVISADNTRLDAHIQFMRGLISLSQLQINAMIDRERLAFDYHDLRLEYLQQQVELATAQAELEPAERDYNLAVKLFDQKIMTEPELDFFAKAYAPLKAKVEATTTLLTEVEQQLDRMKGLGETLYSEAAMRNIEDAMAELDTQRRELERLHSEPLMLRAPMDGIVVAVHRRPGENVVAGEPIVTLSALESEHIKGYLRQPLAFKPEPGMKVKLRARTLRREEIESQIMAVGGQWEVITNVALLRPNAPMEIGLPIAITIPKTPEPLFLPGELVDVSIRRQ